MKAPTLPLVALLCVAALAACEAAYDNVEPGYYGYCAQAGGPSSVPLNSNSMPYGAAGGYAPSPGPSGETLSGPGSAGSGGTFSDGSPADGSPLDGSPSGGAPSVSPDTGSDEVPEGPDPVPDDTPPPDGGKCDMTGRWLLTTHSVTDALGQQQVAHDWHYYEIEQQGDTFRVTKGLLCGNDALGVGLFAVTADFSGAWDGITARMRLDGRTGSSAPTADGGCWVKVDRLYMVRGATVPYYLDPSVPLPTLEQPGTDSAPGWEDWDGDGNPGITAVVSGVVAGEIYVSPRRWDELEGSVPDVSSTIGLAMQWDSETGLIAYNGSGLLTSQAVRAADPNLHFGQMARLAADQAVGDDAAICAAVRQLAPVLAPQASGN